MIYYHLLKLTSFHLVFLFLPALKTCNLWMNKGVFSPEQHTGATSFFFLESLMKMSSCSPEAVVKSVWIYHDYFCRFHSKQQPTYLLQYYATSAALFVLQNMEQTHNQKDACFSEVVFYHLVCKNLTLICIPCNDYFMFTSFLIAAR